MKTRRISQFLSCCLLLVGGLLAGCGPGKATISRAPFGTLADGTEVTLFTLSNGSVTAKVSDYGAHIVSLMVPDRDGNVVDIVTGYDDLEGVAGDVMGFGAVMGRVAGRIAKGRFTLDGKGYELTKNFKGHHLHGGSSGFNKKVWSATTTNRQGRAELTLQYVSPDGEEGYPGTVTATAVYSMAPDGTLLLDISATTDAPTIVNMTQHAYFNLAGPDSGADVLDHTLRIRAQHVAETGEGLIPTGTFIPVGGTPLDFRNPKRIGDRIDAGYAAIDDAGGLDHSYRLEPFSLRPGAYAAQLHDPRSGRTMSVWTTAPCLQVFTPNFTGDGHVGRGEARYEGRAAICLEPQGFPDAPNHPGFPSIALRPGETYRNRIAYRFSAE